MKDLFEDTFLLMLRITDSRVSTIFADFSAQNVWNGWLNEIILSSNFVHSIIYKLLSIVASGKYIHKCIKKKLHGLFL